MRSSVWMTSILLVCSSACSIDEMDFPEKYGKAYCQKVRTCDNESYSSTWEQFDECVDDIGDVVDAFMDVSTTFGGEYDPTNARRCNDVID